MNDGPYFDQLEVGQVFDTAPSMTLTPGVAATHQAILGDRLRLPLDAHLSYAVAGTQSALAHPGLVCDVAIGQSTLVTRHVKANLFYRDWCSTGSPSSVTACSRVRKSLACARIHPDPDVRRPEWRRCG